MSGSTSPSRSLRSPLGRARGLGSAKDGLHHWWMQRLTSVALVPLSIWFVAALVGLRDADWETYVLWVSNPINATMMVLVIAVGLHHAQAGMQVVLEDYVSAHGARVFAVIAVKLICYALAALSIVSVILVALGV